MSEDRFRGVESRLTALEAMVQNFQNADAVSKSIVKRFQSLLDDDITLDPKGQTWIGYEGVAPYRQFRFAGRWKPGVGHNFWGPTGDPNTKFQGMNKWCVMVMAVGNSIGPYGPFEYQGGLLACPVRD